MEDTNEWTGVTEIYDKVGNGFYRANATSTVTFVFILAAIFLNKILGNNVVLNLSILGTLFVFAGFISIVWILSFCLGYTGLTATPLGYVTSVTSNTNMEPRKNDLNPLAPYIWLKDGIQQTQVYETVIGKLSANTQGVDGIFTFSWKDIAKVSKMDSQTINLQRKEKLFLIPAGHRKLSIHFSSPEDSDEFLALAQKYSLQG